MWTNHRILGLAVTEQGIAVAEISASNGQQGALRWASLAFSPEVDLNHPEQLGRELKQLLRQQGFSAGRCAIGLAASWTVAKERIVPPADGEALRGVLSIAAEREFASGAGDLAFDFITCPSPKGLSALLAAVPQRIVDQLAVMAKTAGLTVASVTSSMAALAMATGGTVDPSGRLVLCLLPRGVELAFQTPTGLRTIRHLPISLGESVAQCDALASELRRVIALAPTEALGRPLREVLVWDSIGLGTSAARAIGDKLGLSVRLCALGSDMNVTAQGESAGASQAAALAVGSGDSQVLDFVHSRLAPARQSRMGRKTFWIAAAGVLVVALGVWAVLEWQMGEAEVADLLRQREALSGSVKEAKALADKTKFAGAWYDHRPRFLDCLREVTMAFPEDGRIWASNLTIREDMQAQLTGKSVSEEAALDVLDHLKANRRLSNVKPLYIRQVGGSSKEVSFAIGMSLTGAN